MFNVIGVSFGIGDGTTTFTLPNLKGRFPVAATNIGNDVFESMGQTGGETAHQLTVDELPAHTHTFDDYSTFEVPYMPPRYIEFTDVFDPMNPYKMEFMKIQSSISSNETDSTGGDEAHNTLPPYLVLATAQIKY